MTIILEIYFYVHLLSENNVYKMKQISKVLYPYVNRHSVIYDHDKYIVALGYKYESAYKFLCENITLITPLAYSDQLVNNGPDQ